MSKKEIIIYVNYAILNLFILKMKIYAQTISASVIKFKRKQNRNTMNKILIKKKSVNYVKKI